MDEKETWPVLQPGTPGEVGSPTMGADAVTICMWTVLDKLMSLPSLDLC